MKRVSKYFAKQFANFHGYWRLAHRWLSASAVALERPKLDRGILTSRSRRVSDKQRRFPDVVIHGSVGVLSNFCIPRPLDAVTPAAVEENEAIAQGRCAREVDSRELSGRHARARVFSWDRMLVHHSPATATLGDYAWPKPLGIETRIVPLIGGECRTTERRQTATASATSGLYERERCDRFIFIIRAMAAIGSPRA